MGFEVGPVVLPEDMDADWFNRVLGQAMGGGRLSAVSQKPIGTGQVGENIRFQLTWDSGQSSEQPSDSTIMSVVGKFPSDNEQSFATAKQLGIYASEVGFYRDVAPRLDIRVPEVHYIGFDPDTTRFSLIMEDISAAVQGDQLQGTDVATAEIVIDQAVKLHASTWGAVDELAELSWVTKPDDQTTLSRNQVIRSVFDGFASRYADVLSPGDIELGQELMIRLDHLSAVQIPNAADGVSGARCLVHQDFRLDNMLFGTDPSAPPVTIVDWQTCRLGSGPADVAYFVGAGLPPEDRRRNERRLVERYVDGLAAAGIVADFEVIWRRYVFGSASGYIMAVLASQIVGSTERGDAMFCTMAERHAAQIRDLGLFDLLDLFDSGPPDRP